MSLKVERLAFDFASARKYDEDGRLHVAVNNISRANVCPYYGREIPNGEELGLDPNRSYRLLRDPEELAKAASTFNHLPLLDRHVHVTADSHQADLIIGSVGSQAAFDGEHLQNSIVIWKKSAIDGVEDKSKSELSSCYHYTAVMQPGTYKGAAFDGRMTNIRGNHVALVRKGRAGSTVVVGDSEQSRPRMFGVLNKKFSSEGIFDMSASRKMAAGKKSNKAVSVFPLVAESILRGYLGPRLAADAELDFKPLIKALGTDPAKLNTKAFTTAFDAAMKPKNGKEVLAADADVADVQEIISQMEDMAPQIADLVVGGPEAVAAGLTQPGDDPTNPAESTDPSEDRVDATTAPAAKADPADSVTDPPKTAETDPVTADPNDDGSKMAKVIALLQDKLTPEEIAQIKEILEDKAVAQDTKKKEEVVSKSAMDAAIVAARKDTMDEMHKRMREVHAAKEAVLPYVAIKSAMDSADEVYRAAFKHLNVDVKNVHPSAFPAILKAQPLPLRGSLGAAPRAVITAQDSDDYKSKWGDFDKRLKAS